MPFLLNSRPLVRATSCTFSRCSQPFISIGAFFTTGEPEVKRSQGTVLGLSKSRGLEPGTSDSRGLLGCCVLCSESELGSVAAVLLQQGARSSAGRFRTKWKHFSFTRTQGYHPHWSSPREQCGQRDFCRQVWRLPSNYLSC